MSAMKLLLVSAAALALAACATIGPTPAELAQAIAEARPSASAAPEIRRLRCVTFPEETTEFHCRWRQRDASGAWRTFATYLAVDSHGYHVIDEIGLEDHSSP